jgi:hypothetical protein
MFPDTYLRRRYTLKLPFNRIHILPKYEGGNISREKFTFKHHDFWKSGL